MCRQNGAVHGLGRLVLRPVVRTPVRLGRSPLFRHGMNIMVVTYDVNSVTAIIRKTDWAHLLAFDRVAVTGRNLVVATSALASTGNVASA